ncbi:AraC family transcriptional regulator [Synechocystis salina]|uniref:AraC family transcriptional regulator n=1 Tax=Synechocystis salina TaxID=945780 RepID=UPI001D149CAA|nr:AraC family transcriptional regulator [Synechocystis salina]
MREIGDRPWTVYDLCQQLHVSERTLRYGFQEIFGIGPKAICKLIDSMGPDDN